MRQGIEFRFMLSHPEEGEVYIDEPVGWSDVKFTLPRDEKYNSVLFEYSTTLEFRRANSHYDGGAEFILFIENKYGSDAILNLQVEVSDHGGEWDIVYVGKLNLEDLFETEKGVTCISEQEDFWTIFNQRSDLQVSFKDNQSVDGVSLQPYEPYTLSMHSKVLVKQTKAEIAQEVLLPPSPTNTAIINAGLPGFPDPSKTGIGDQPDEEFVSRTSYITFDFSAPTSDELKDYWKVGGAALTEPPPEIYTAAEAGLHTFDIHLDFDVLLHANHLTPMETARSTCFYDEDIESFVGLFEDVFIKVELIIRDASDTEKYRQTITWADVNLCGLETATIPGEVSDIFLSEFDLEVGDQVYLYSSVQMDADYERLLADSKIQFWVGYILKEGSYLKITGKTFTEPSEAPALRIHDVFQNLCNKLTNRDDSFHSETFGYIGAPYHSYTENGVFADYVIQNGFNIRNFPWVDRPLQVDFKTLYESIDAIIPLSLSLEEIDGVQKIRIESLGYAYTKDPILSLTHINKIKRYIAKDKFYNQIKIGYEKSLPEDINGLDEFCTVHNYTTDLRTIGNTLTLLSKVIASGSLIEVTRRNQYNTTLTTDTQYDNSLFIVATLHDNPLQAERNEYFDTVNNLLSPETAYNLRLWPAYNLLRQGNRINGGLLKKLGTQYKFQSGEGNYIVQMEQKDSEIVYPGSYNGDLLEGGTNINWAYADLPEVEPLWAPHIYEFSYPLSLRQLNILKANRNKSVYITGDLFHGNGIQAFILEVEHEPNRGLAKWKMLASNELPFNYVPEDAGVLLLQDGFDLLMENGDLILI